MKTLDAWAEELGCTPTEALAIIVALIQRQRAAELALVVRRLRESPRPLLRGFRR
jgi:hypothetical protein